MSRSSFTSPDTGELVSDWDRLSEWVSFLDDSRLACLVEIAAVLAADQIGVYSESPDL